ncbi:MAG: zinc ribbon domain-containing protein [Spirochaetaceae bacterium]
MPYCSYCGVEVDKETVTCPLCGAEIPAASEEPPLFTGDYPHIEHRLHYKRRPFTAHEKRVVLWLFSLILAVPLTVIIAVNFNAAGEITWALYPITAFAGGWIAVAVGLFFRGFWKLFMLYLSLAIVLSLVFSILSGAASIFLNWGVPIIALVSALTLGCAFYGRKTEKRGSNLAAVIVWALALLCFGIDGLISFHLGFDRFPLSWSIIVAAALLPTGALLMYIHYRFVRTFSLKRYFNA